MTPCRRRPWSPVPAGAATTTADAAAGSVATTARAAAARTAAAAAADHPFDHRRRATGEAAAAGVRAVASGIDAAAAVGGVRGDHRPHRNAGLGAGADADACARADARPLLDRSELDRDRSAMQLLQVVLHRQEADPGRPPPRASISPGACREAARAPREPALLLSATFAGARATRRRLDSVQACCRARPSRRRLRELGLRLRGGGGGLWLRRRCASSNVAIGTETTGATFGSGLRSGSHGISMKKIAQVIRMRSAMYRKRASSSDDVDHGSTPSGTRRTALARGLALAVARVVAGAVHRQSAGCGHRPALTARTSRAPRTRRRCSRRAPR